MSTELNPEIMADEPDVPHWELSGPQAESIIDSEDIWTETDRPESGEEG